MHYQQLPTFTPCFTSHRHAQTCANPCFIVHTHTKGRPVDVFITIETLWTNTRTLRCALWPPKDPISTSHTPLHLQKPLLPPQAPLLITTRSSSRPLHHPPLTDQHTPYRSCLRLDHHPELITLHDPASLTPSHSPSYSRPHLAPLLVSFASPSPQPNVRNTSLDSQAIFSGLSPQWPSNPTTLSHRPLPYPYTHACAPTPRSSTPSPPPNPCPYLSPIPLPVACTCSVYR